MRALRWLFAWLQLAGVALESGVMGRTALPPCLCSCGSFEVRDYLGRVARSDSGSGASLFISMCRVGARCDLADPPWTGLHLQRELTFVLFIARVFIAISD